LESLKVKGGDCSTGTRWMIRAKWHPRDGISRMIQSGTPWPIFCYLFFRISL